MLFKEVRDAYARYANSLSDDPLFHELSPPDRDSRYKRNLAIQQLLERGQPFVIDDDAYVLVNTLDMEVKTGQDLGPLMLEAPLPFGINWFEYDEEGTEEDGPGHYRTGVIIRKGKSGVFASCFFKAAGEAFIEPFIMFSAAEGEKLDVQMNPHTLPRLMKMMDGPEEDRFNQACSVAMSDAALAISTVVKTTHLIATRQGPLDQATEPLMSRQERRRNERQGVLPKGKPPVFTRIRINEQGRLHLAAVDEEEGGPGGARRRAHRVRGHFMRTVNGMSWRKAHVRGFGQMNNTVRKVGVAQGGE